jgi:hypothetical protein
MTTAINASAARITEMNFGNGKDARELQDSELEAVSGGASMVEYAIIRGAVLAIAVAKRLSS